MKTIETDIENTLRDLVFEHGPTSAEIKVIRDRARTTGGIIVSLSPLNKSAAEIIAHADVEFGGVDLIFGRGTELEIPSDGQRYTSLQCLDEMRKLCSAVLQGKFREEVWTRGSVVIQTDGYLEVDGEEMKLVHRHKLFGNPFKQMTKTEYFYEAYGGSNPKTKP